MFITKQRHKAEVSELQASLSQQESRVIELEARAERAERAAHQFAEEARYTLESAAWAVHGRDSDLHTIAHALPYLYSGRRHWNDESHPGTASDARVGAQQVARAYGFELPPDPVEAVKSILELASMLLMPSNSLPVEGLKIRYPVEQLQNPSPVTALG
jgi:hypothetical protein